MIGGSIFFKRVFYGLIVPDHLIFFPDFSEILHENGIILPLKEEGSCEPPEPPLDPPLGWSVQRLKVVCKMAS